MRMRSDDPNLGDFLDHVQNQIIDAHTNQPPPPAWLDDPHPRVVPLGAGVIARDVQPRQEVHVDGEWHRVTIVAGTEREDGSEGVWLYFGSRPPKRLDADEPIEVR